VFKPVIIYNVLQSIRLIADAARSFTDNCIVGIVPNEARIARLLSESLMLVTALNPHVGYDNAAKIAKLAHAKDLTLKQAASELNLIEADKFDALIQPEKMVRSA
jgi:fumarate hydratase class II